MKTKNRLRASPSRINPPFVAIAVLVVSLVPFAGAAEKSPGNTLWPYRIPLGDTEISLYEPQIESYRDESLEARAAFSVTVKGKAPEFGALRYDATVDRAPRQGLVQLTDILITDVKYPGGDEEEEERLKQDLTEQLRGVRFSLSNQQLKEHMDVGAGNGGTDRFKNKAPRIYFEEEPAVLVIVDGDPVLEPVKGMKHKYVVNTAFFIVQDPSDEHFYLKGGRWWYRSKSVRKGWEPVKAPPREIQHLADEAFTGEAADKDPSIATLDTPPKVIVSYTPAELIVTDGKPKFVPVADTELLYVDNSEDDIIFDIQNQQYYVLLSGRWYSAGSLDSRQWRFVRPDRLPPDFEKIPADSAVASVRANVTGTPEAEDALLANAVPQTATIDRESATVFVQYDGEPSFRRIGGTAVYYAANADKSVLRIHGRYYAVDNGVWFVSNGPDGPWAVATEVPPEVQDIPPSAPVYHVRHVYVYGYTPQVVYVGYTPGYYCSYVHYGTIIYGTGFYYRPWYRAYYYPWPMTFGFAVHFNPFTGWWGFPVGVSYGWISWGWFPYSYAYWGPSGYVYGYRHGYYHGYRHGYYDGHRNGYRRGYTAGRTQGYRGITPAELHRRPASSVAYFHRKDGVREVSPRAMGGRKTVYPKGDRSGSDLKTLNRRNAKNARPPLGASTSQTVKTGRDSSRRIYNRRSSAPSMKTTVHRPFQGYKTPPRAHKPPTRSVDGRPVPPPKRVYKRSSTASPSPAKSIRVTPPATQPPARKEVPRAYAPPPPLQKEKKKTTSYTPERSPSHRADPPPKAQRQPSPNKNRYQRAPTRTPSRAPSRAPSRPPSSSRPQSGHSRPPSSYKR